MKRGFKALAVLVAVATASAGPLAFAVCAEIGGFAIFQCGDKAYFAPTPAGAGAVSPVFWQIGYGNSAISTGQGTEGYGVSGPGPTFNGNDSGSWGIELLDGNTLDPLIPAGAICLGSNNWGNAGIDGCCDNFRDAGQSVGNDGILNPLYNVAYERAGYSGYASNDWVVDYPMGVLLREATGHWFAVAAVASMPRTGVDDYRTGFFNFKYVSNGLTNAATGAPNVIPWQRIPGDRDPGDASTNFVVNASFVPGDTNTTKVLDLQWNHAVLYSDQSNRPTTNSTMVAPGAGVADLGNLIRYVVEKQAIVDGNNPYGSLNPNNWTAVVTKYPPENTAQITVDPDTCVRLHTYFGKEPAAVPPSVAECRLAKCGDLGYDVVSHPACIGGPLAADGKVTALIATRRQGNVEVSWKTTSELSVSRFEVYAVTKKGSVKVADASCTQCVTGQGGTYNVKIPASSLKGARTVEVLAVGPNEKARANIK